MTVVTVVKVLTVVTVVTVVTKATKKLQKKLGTKLLLRQKKMLQKIFILTKRFNF